MNDERPVWKIVLSICITLFLVIRIAYRCSNSNNNAVQNNMIQNTEQMNAMKNFQEIQKGNIANIAAKSNQILYLSHKELDSLTTIEKKSYYLRKVTQDSVVNLDITTKIKVAKESYFQQNYDDSLRMGFKTPDNLTVLIHDFESKQSLEENFKSIKRGMKPSSLVYDKGTDKAKLFAYTLTKNDKKINGYAMGIHEADYFLFLEFESDKMSKDRVKMEALNYLLTNLKSPK